MTERVRTIGILGGGQLGWMLGIAARRLGLDCVFLDPAPNCPSDMIGPRIHAAYDDAKALDQLAQRCDVVTYEFENVPATSAGRLASHRPVRPGPRSLEVAQDRLVEKSFIADLGVPVPAFAAIDGPGDLHSALDAVGVPAIFKTRRGGYDGKGQARVLAPADAEPALASLAGAPAIAEAMVPFDLEASVLVARGTDGGVVTWTPTRNLHAAGILRRSDAPGNGIPESADDEMRLHAATIAEALDHVGVLAVEFFVVGGHVLVNEIAPRVHNSGHLTIEHAMASQFENHVRAVAGLPLGETTPRVPHATMLNAIGDRPVDEDLDRLGVLRVGEAGECETPQDGADAFWHDYRKSPRPGRKVGHLTVVGDHADPDRIEALAAIVPGASMSEAASD